MQIKHMVASFGKLDGAELSVQPGLNIIYAPNESGKSTWCHFIRTMLYGLPTRDRGPLADKNRFAPWSGAAPSGRMELSSAGQDYTVVRRTQRAAAPMGEFSCTYSGTADAVPDITAQNLGESLLGISRDVFVRSAFIGQSGLALDKDAELERRIAALITSGEEDISFTQVNERLKKQLNRRKHNKTGLIPALEEEIAQISAALERLQALHRQEESARLQQAQHSRQAQELRLRLEQWDALEKQQSLCTYLEAQKAAATAADHARMLQEADPALPESSELARLSGVADSVERSFAAAAQSEETAQQCRAAADEARTVWEQDPLYPATAAQLEDRIRALLPPPGRFSLLALLPALLIGSGAGFGVWYFLHNLPAAIGAGGLLYGAILLIYNCIRLRRNRAAAQKAAEAQAALQQQADAYLTLQQRADEAHDRAEQAAAAASGLQQNCRESLLQLLGQTRTFAPDAADLSGLRLALDSAALRRHKLDTARQNARETALHCRMLQQHLPQGPLPDPDAVLPRPTVPAAQIREALPRAEESARSARSQLDALTGQLRAMGDRDSLESRLARKREELTQLQAEYSAIAAAMNALGRADQIMQNRFSPELGHRAAEIFAQLTGGQYEQVFFDRSFALSASPAGDPAPRDIRLLSQGTADQLYLATRLAICQMVLPETAAVPLILDDALANFDNARMASALDWLARESRQRQILLFTCHRRETDYLSGQENVHCITL